MLAEIPMVNGLYWVEHQGDVDLAAAVDPEVVSIEKLHWLMGHIAPEAAKSLVEKGLVEGFKLDTSSEMPKSCNACEYGKAHRKPVKRSAKLQGLQKLGMKSIQMFGDHLLSRQWAEGNIIPCIPMIIHILLGFTFNVLKVRPSSSINNMKHS